MFARVCLRVCVCACVCVCVCACAARSKLRALSVCLTLFLCSCSYSILSYVYKTQKMPAHCCIYKFMFYIYLMKYLFNISEYKAMLIKLLIYHRNIYFIHICVCMYVYISGGPLSALTCCVNARFLSAIKKILPLIYSQSWVGSWVYTTQVMMTFTLIF